ncbi:hypothetical protein CEXT_335801 [Caerostris extrusa]|uniref:Uncharacterized protein n=1 Tax=Caerostris extrusa TaxID=172846 RepID=A0AAV4M3E8_CAEEX|nr:hypothetical protein CEXT_335801 [Caerostris extrusa]
MILMGISGLLTLMYGDERSYPHASLVTRDGSIDFRELVDSRTAILFLMPQQDNLPKRASGRFGERWSDLDDYCRLLNKIHMIAVDTQSYENALTAAH